MLCWIKYRLRWEKIPGQSGIYVQVKQQQQLKKSTHNFHSLNVMQSHISKHTHSHTHSKSSSVTTQQSLCGSNCVWYKKEKKIQFFHYLECSSPDPALAAFNQDKLYVQMRRQYSRCRL